MNYLGHSVFNCVTIAGTAYVARMFAIAEPVFITTFLVSGIFATFFLSPDLDLSYSVPSSNCGLFKVVWVPYQLVSKHRGLSHNIFFCSISRVVYLLALALIVLLAWNLVPMFIKGVSHATAISSAENIIGTAFCYSWQKVSAYKGYFIAVGSGIIFSDACHIFIDRIF